MPEKRRTKKQVKELAISLIQEKENGATTEELTEKYGHGATYVNRIIREHKKGKTERKNSLSDIVEIATTEQNRLVDKFDLIEIIIYADDDISKNFKLKIERPNSKSSVDFDMEMQKAILKSLRWMHAGREFNIS